MDNHHIEKQPQQPETSQSSQQEPPLRPAQTDKKYYCFLVLYLVLLSALGSFVNDMYTPSLYWRFRL